MAALRSIGHAFALVVLAAPLATAQAAPKAARRIVDRLEASVNASPILLSDIRRFRQTLPLRAQLDPLFAGSALAEKAATASDPEVVTALIQDRLISSAFPITDAEVEQEIQTIQASNRIDRAKLKAALSQQGFRFEDYFELIRLSTAKRNLIDRDIRTKVSISDDDVRAHYRANLPAGTSGASRIFTAKVIALSRQNYRSEALMKESADRAAAALKAGDSFEEVVRRYSDDPSKDSDGDLGVLQEDQIAPVIRSALGKLRPGETSAVVGDAKTRLMIFKLISVAEGDDPRFQRLKEDLRNQLAASEYQHQIQLWLARQEQQAHVHRAPLQTIASGK